MHIFYFIRSVYGKSLCYIADEETARLVFKLTGKKTISKEEIEILEKLGCTFERTFDPAVLA